jgi:hypothetical protein
MGDYSPDKDAEITPEMIEAGLDALREWEESVNAVVGDDAMPDARARQLVIMIARRVLHATSGYKVR